ncbi:MAG: hypothetical protein QM495_11530 [Lutibacter sp.]|uniref:hypothetical protein n=1 Tax=Lutibacter sp. TaxID=1925666 RepID=UPI00385FE64B
MKTLTTLILVLLAINVSGQSTKSSDLKNALSNLEKENNLKNQSIYFELFPNTFNGFLEMFGFENGKVAPLYDGYDYVQVLFELDKISKKKQMKKWIEISIGGKWEADAVNYFQHNLQPRILINVNLTYELLSERTDKEIESFFYFFFNEIHPQYEIVPTELKKLQNKNKEFYKLLLTGHKRAIKDSGH